MKRIIKLIALVLTAVFIRLSARASNNEPDMNSTPEQYKVSLTVNGNKATATIVANQATAELKELLKNGNIYVSMNDYGGFEKVGTLPQSFTRNDKYTTTLAGDIMLYQGNQIVIFYDSNSWNYTPIGRIDTMTASDIKSFLGTGNISLEISLISTSGTRLLKSEKTSLKTEYYDISGNKVSEETKGFLIRKNGNRTTKIWK